MAGRFSGRRLREIRKQSGLSREQVAVTARVSASALIRYEQGRTTPSVNAGAAIAEVLGVQLPDLLDVGADPSTDRFRVADRAGTAA